MSLKEDIAKHRAEWGLADHDEEKTPPPEPSKPASLEISIASKNEYWELPWMCFNGACFSTNVATPDGLEKTERLELYPMEERIPQSLLCG